MVHVCLEFNSHLMVKFIHLLKFIHFTCPIFSSHISFVKKFLSERKNVLFGRTTYYLLDVVLVGS